MEEVHLTAKSSKIRHLHKSVSFLCYPNDAGLGGKSKITITKPTDGTKRGRRQGAQFVKGVKRSDA